MPAVPMFRMLGSGTEGCMAAIRVARLATGKKNVVKMGGAYHGWSDQLAYGLRIPGTRHHEAHGVPKYVFRHTQEFFPGRPRRPGADPAGQPGPRRHCGRAHRADRPGERHAAAAHATSTRACGSCATSTARC